MLLYLDELESSRTSRCKVYKGISVDLEWREAVEESTCVRVYLGVTEVA